MSIVRTVTYAFSPVGGDPGGAEGWSAGVATSTPKWICNDFYDYQNDSTFSTVLHIHVSSTPIGVVDVETGTSYGHRLIVIYNDDGVYFATSATHGNSDIVADCTNAAKYTTYEAGNPQPSISAYFLSEWDGSMTPASGSYISSMYAVDTCTTAGPTAFDTVADVYCCSNTVDATSIPIYINMTCSAGSGFSGSATIGTLVLVSSSYNTAVGADAHYSWVLPNSIATGIYTAIIHAVEDSSVTWTYTLHVLDCEETAIPTIDVKPDTANVDLSGTQQFTATVTGISDTDVTWSCSGGSITSTGLWTAPDTAGTYTVTGTLSADSSYSDTSVVTVASGGGTLPGTPPVPSACIASLTSISLRKVLSSNWLSDTTSLTLQISTDGGSSWVSICAGIVVATAYEITYSISSSMKIRFVAVNSHGTTTGAAVDLVDFCSATQCVTPDPPEGLVTAKDCTNSQIVITPPDFGDGITSMVLERTSDGGTTWDVVHTFTDSTAWDDTNVVKYTTYQYRISQCNAVGCSDYSSATTAITMSSSTSSGTWLTPASGVTVTGKVYASYTFVDTNGTISLSQVFLGGKLVGTPTLIQGTYKSGTMQILLNTKRTSQGSLVLSAEWKGSDGCYCKIAETIVVENSGTSGIRYRDYKLVPTAPTGYVYHTACPQMWLGAPDTSPLQWFVGQAALTTTVPTAVAAGTSATDAQAAFDAMQAVPLTDGAAWVSVSSREAGRLVQATSGVAIKTTGADVVLRVRAEPYMLAVPYLTETDKVQKIRKIADAKYLIVGHTPARVHHYTSDGLVLVVDFSTTYSFETLTDACELDDKLYAVVNNTLYSYDTDSTSVAAWRLSVVKLYEDVQVQFVETVGSLIFVVGTLDSQTVCYWVAGDQFGYYLSNSITVNMTWTDGITVYLASGAKLYSYVPGNDSFTLLNSVDFEANITAIGPNMVGLATGGLYVYSDGSWSQVCSLESDAPVQAIGEWYGATDALHALFGSNSRAVYEVDSAGAADATVDLPDSDTETVAQITAISQYVGSSSETNGIPDDERMLIGTGNNGLLFDFDVSRLSTDSGAFVFTSIEDVLGTAMMKESTT